MVYLFCSLVGSFCYAKLVMSYPAWPGIYVIMCKIQIPLSFSSFWYCIVERKNSCFIVRRCLNRYKIDKFCTIERRMEDIFAQLNKYSRWLFGNYLKLVPLLEFYLGATRNWGSLSAPFGGSFGMGRGLPNSPSAQTQQPFSCSFSHRPWSSLRKAFAPNSGWLLIWVCTRQ